MRTTLLLILVTGLLAGVDSQSNKIILDVLEVIKHVVSIASGLNDLTGGDKHEELLHRFEDVTNRFDELLDVVEPRLKKQDTNFRAAIPAAERLAMTLNIQGLDHELSSVIAQLREMESIMQQVRWESTINDLEELLRDVTNNYDRFLLYQKNASAVNPFTLLDFAKKAVSHEPRSLQSTLYSVRDVVLTSQVLSRRAREAAAAPPASLPGRQRRYAIKHNLFRELQALVESRVVVCGLDKSPQQLAYNIYSTLAAVLAKDYAMVQFAYMLLELHGKGSFAVESQYFTESYKTISEAVAEEVGSVMGMLDPVFWRCDPARHQRGITYEEVTALLQIHLENEVDLSRSGSCAGECSDYRTATSSGCYGATGQPTSSSALLCERQRPCNGTLHHCRFVTSSATVCLYDASQNTGRRYNWIQAYSGHLYGQKDNTLGSCAATVSTWGWTRWFTSCSPCFCLCDDDTNSERYFSLLPTVADVAQNKIVTGVRFVKLDGVFYIQLEQSEAGQVGFANTSTAQWKPIDRRVNITRDVEGRDFVRLSYDRRSVLLQDLRGSPDEVVTGISFHFLKPHLTFGIQVTSISESGSLSADSSRWLSGNGPDSHLPRLRLHSGPVPPTLSAARSWPDSEPGQTVSFEASSLNADAGQTTLPLLDSQPVAPRPAAWLSGVGLFHKGEGSGGSGGFLALSVRVANMAPSEGNATGTKIEAVLQRARFVGLRVSSEGEKLETPFSASVA